MSANTITTCRAITASDEGNYPAPSLRELPLGSIQPAGWIRKQLDLMVDGMVGHLEEISGFLAPANG